MRLLILFIVIIGFNCILCKNNVKKLTESMGQEVIELNGPIKELPPGLEEEPSGENEEDSTSSSSTTQLATRKETKKITMITTSTSKTTSKPAKDIDVTDSVSQEDEEVRIEKELAEMYKDNADYKADSGAKEDANGTTTSDAPIAEDDVKPIGRKGGSFKFQPDSNKKAAVERFRTSVDEINCKRVTNKLVLEEDLHDSSSKIIFDFVLFGLTMFVTI